MKDTSKISTLYFQAPKDYFWRWAENGTILELKNGSTVCYREDLVQFFKELTINGFPPLASILLVLLAGQNGWEEHKKRTFLRSFFILSLIHI